MTSVLPSIILFILVHSYLRFKIFTVMKMLIVRFEVLMVVKLLMFFFSGLQHHVVLPTFQRNVLPPSLGSHSLVGDYHEDRDNKFFWNTGNHLQDYTVSQPRRPQSINKSVLNQIWQIRWSENRSPLTTHGLGTNHFSLKAQSL
jgi:hypothetical protein